MESSACITKSWFTHNEGGSNQLGLKNLAGGAIFADKSTLTIVNSFFERNSAESGGAIYCHCNKRNTLTLHNSTFTENAAKCKVSWIEITTCYGGVLHSKGCKLLINDSIFQNNLAIEVVEVKTMCKIEIHIAMVEYWHFLKAQHLSIAVLSHITERIKARGGVIFAKKTVLNIYSTFFVDLLKQGC